MAEMLMSGLVFGGGYVLFAALLTLADIIDQGRQVRRPKRGGAESLVGYDVVAEAERAARTVREVGRG